MIKNKRFLKYAFLLMNVLLMFTISCETDNDNISQTVTDIDGNVYHLVTIGTQVWMVENLKTTRLNDGTSLSLVTGPSEWGYIGDPAYCSYNNTTNADTINVYGRIYNRSAVRTGKLCPTGWHVPTNADWDTLINYLGGADVASGKLKETDTTHWMSPNTGADNSSGFTALPGGYRTSDGGYFYHMARCGYWWSATEGAPNKYLFFDRINVVNFYGDGGNDGYSVRCVKD
jgi:uncharacterized protein (TIGR02145 family)